MPSDILSTSRCNAYQHPKQPKEKGPVRICETVLRDAHQSLLATRMTTSDMQPALKMIDRVGYWSSEMWGGATFDSCLRFLREDPWERLKIIRKGLPNTRLQMLLRGQNLVGYKHYPDDIVVEFIKRSVHCGVDVFRVFDALNDVRNMQKSIDTIVKLGKIAEGAISYTVSPFHTVERYTELAKKLEALGCQILCIKDMAGLLTPFKTAQLVKAIRSHISIPIHIHSHATSGMSEASYLKGVEEGALLLDGAISSMAGGTSQPPTESIVAMLQNTPYATGLDLGLLSELAEYFRNVRKKYAQFESPFNNVDPRVLRFQIPGGMISNLANQLREQDALDRMEEVLEEVPRVRSEMGYPPLVTPTSQIVGTQATLNILLNERYKRLSVESRSLLLGKYGQCPSTCDPQLQKQAEQQEKTKAIEQRPADFLAPQWEEAKAAVESIEGCLEENALSYAIFPQVAMQFFQEKDRKGPSQEDAAIILASLSHKLRESMHSNHYLEKQRPMNPWKWAGRLENNGRNNI